MLLAVEGGGFFSSSASGYSKGLTLLFLGQKNDDDKPMRVSPWNQYQLVDQEPDPDPDLQLASAAKNRLSRGCASFVCFGRASAGPDSPSHLKVGPAQNQDVSPSSLGLDKRLDRSIDVEDDDGNVVKLSLKSSLKKPSNSDSVPVQNVIEHEHDLLSEKGNDIAGHTERRKVQWTDTCGSELAEIREFEPRCVCRK
ncbi:uncharacterized protein LOC102625427 isoform X2 [Citrus sinensis]|uniref:uncharacterized protein LOC102625427 isoform X2 n=1 Tax=Citrus sinensis TaxID=2711 RepID=UPI002278A145|nr:uncharacterized protein LOC102625427 isoform X2 [Citrus sinensis]